MRATERPATNAAKKPSKTWFGVLTDACDVLTELNGQPVTGRMELPVLNGGRLTVRPDGSWMIRLSGPVEDDFDVFNFTVQTPAGPIHRMATVDIRHRASTVPHSVRLDDLMHDARRPQNHSSGDSPQLTIRTRAGQTIDVELSESSEDRASIVLHSDAAVSAEVLEDGLLRIRPSENFCGTADVDILQELRAGRSRRIRLTVDVQPILQLHLTDSCPPVSAGV